jgi:hypothetical protein
MDRNADVSDDRTAFILYPRKKAELRRCFANLVESAASGAVA